MITQKPDIAIGFGGYPTVAPMLAAKIFSTPLIIHEQNAIIGRGNKLLSKISNKLALSFENTKKIENASDPNEYLDIENDLSSRIGLKTKIIFNKKKKNGSLTIKFKNLEQLEFIMKKLQ